MVRGFRGIAKSWITCAYVCWRLYCDAQLNILIISASKSKADEFSTFIKRLINEMDMLAQAIPRTRHRADAHRQPLRNHDAPAMKRKKPLTCSRRPGAFLGDFFRNRRAAFGADAAGVASERVAAMRA